ncbi:MAG: diguanylate cyclase [Terracidiphilus sp.]|jgi:diguanylate cyclase (GGDEF)-like protein
MATATPGQPLAEVEEALARKGFRLKFSPRLEAAYETALGAGRNRAIAIYLVIYLAVKLLFLLANLQVGTQVFRVSMTLRLGIVLPLTLLAVFLLLRPMPSWVHGVAAFAPLTAETALVMLLGRLSGSAVATRYVMAAGIGIFAQTLLMRAPFRHCVRGLAVALAVFCVLSEVRWPGHFGPPVSGDYLVFVIGFSLPALYERHSREWADRREFLLNETNRLRMEEILRMNKHLERLSSLDALTGIFNRRYLDSALARQWEIAVHMKRWIGILMIDIDHFKSINDTAGHHQGDLYLEQVAQAIQRSVRAGVDTVARYGGEEFVAILPDADVKLAMAIGERIREAIEATGLPAARGGVVTVSAGATAVHGETSFDFNAEDLVAAADLALYDAKNSGRNRVMYHDTALCEAPPMLALPNPNG